MMTPGKNGKPTRQEVGQNFLEFCERIGYGEIELEIADGVPYLVKRGLQKVRFDIKNNKGDTTFDLPKEEK